MSFFKKKAVEEAPEAMDLDAVMKKFDRESNTRPDQTALQTLASLPRR